MNEFDQQQTGVSEYRELYAGRIDQALELDSFRVLKETNFKYDFNSSFEEMAGKVMSGNIPGENKIVVFDFDGVFYSKSGYFNPLSEFQRKFLNDLNKEAEVFIVSSRREKLAKIEIAKMLDKYNPILNDIRSILGSEKVMINTNRQKQRSFPLNNKSEDGNYGQLVNQFTKLSGKIKANGGNVNITHIADTAHITCLGGNDLQMWRGDFKGKTELMALKNFIELFKSLEITVSQSEIQFMDHGGELTKLGRFIMKHTGDKLSE
jgi:hypothetical protein